MEGISVDLPSYFKMLRKHWKLIPTVAAVVLAISAGLTIVLPKTYQSQLQFFVSTVDTTDSSELAQGGNFLQQRVKSYAQLVTAPLVLGPVVDQLGLDSDTAQLAEQVTATIPPDTVLIDVTVEADRADRAEQIGEAIGRQFPQTVSELERVEADRHSPVKVTLIKAPTFESVPVSPQPARNLALGVILGLLLGVGAAVLRHLLDTKVRTREDIAALVEDLPVLGTIPFDNEASKRPLVSDIDTHATRSESFRALRTNLAFVGTGERARTIVMTSSLPGEGKTTTTANLAIMLVESGSSVCLIEGDLRRPRLLEYFGLEGSVGLTDLLIGRADLSDVLQPYGRRGLTLLGAGQIPPNPSELLGSPGMRHTIQQLADRFEYVLIDAPPLLPVTDAAVLSTLADGAVMVVGSGLVSREQLLHAFDSLEAVNGRLLGVTLNRLPRNADPGSYYGYEYEYHPRRGRNGSSVPEINGASNGPSHRGTRLDGETEPWEWDVPMKAPQRRDSRATDDRDTSPMTEAAERW